MMESDEVDPPSYTSSGLLSSVQLEEDIVPSAPPPSYQDVIFEWNQDQLDSFRSRSSQNLRPSSRLNNDLSPRDQMEMERRGRRLFYMSLFCWVVDLVILIVGATNRRAVGTFTVSNVVALLVFSVGIVNFMFPRTHVNRILVAQIYFFLLYAVGILGILLSFYYAVTIRSRVADFCAVPNRTCPDTRTSLYVGGVALTLAGTVIWFVFFSIFARSAFLYLGAAERTRLAALPEDPEDDVVSNGHSSLMASVHRLAAFLPHYKAHGRRLSGYCARCSGCSPVVCLAVCCPATFILSFVLCVSLPAGVAREVFCFIVEFLFRLFLEAVLSLFK